MIDATTIVTRELWRAAWSEHRAYIGGRVPYLRVGPPGDTRAVAGSIASWCYAERRWTRTDTQLIGTRLAYRDAAPTTHRDALRRLWRRLP